MNADQAVLDEKRLKYFLGLKIDMRTYCGLENFVNNFGWKYVGVDQKKNLSFSLEGTSYNNPTEK